MELWIITYNEYENTIILGVVDSQLLALEYCEKQNANFSKYELQHTKNYEFDRFELGTIFPHGTYALW